jgi:hypothetical protein
MGQLIVIAYHAAAGREASSIVSLLEPRVQYAEIVLLSDKKESGGLRYVANAAALIMVVGPEWSHDLILKGDPVTASILTAIESKVPVIPVFFGGAKLPSKEVLPQRLWGLYKIDPILIDSPKGLEHLVSRLTAHGVRTVSLYRHWLLAWADRSSPEPYSWAISVGVSCTILALLIHLPQFRTTFARSGRSAGPTLAGIGILAISGWSSWRLFREANAWARSIASRIMLYAASFVLAWEAALFVRAALH